VLFHAGGRIGSSPQPVLDVVRTDEQLIAQVAVSTTAGSKPSVVVEVRPEGSAAPLLRLSGRVGKSASQRLFAQEVVQPGSLPPGRYTVAAVVNPGAPPLLRAVTIEQARERFPNDDR
jgi:hypothetical protein